ncbi:MAG: UvrD-helicase domain-containing protein [Synergistaceae bacterium]|jgi:ATP-dependent exoDNAse (exonuclease V) beta subunit|nr:UvrD-helicase domain-containing protein [Synergistaceae bacterium]
MSGIDADKLLAGARPEQRRAICGLSPLTVVSAGAGTGKTQTLANRFAWLLASDPDCRVDQILTLTFTNAAATQMRDRIRSVLLSWLSSGIPHLRDAIDRLDEAYISTIHAFALRVIKEAGEGLDIGPGARIADGPMELEFWKDFKWSLQTGAIHRFAENLGQEWREYASLLREDGSYIDLLNYYGSDAIAELGRGACEVFGSMNLRPADLRDMGALPEEAVCGRIAARLSETWGKEWEIWHGVIFPLIAPLLEKKSTAKFPFAMKTLYGEWHGRERSAQAEKDFFVALVNGAMSNLSGGADLKEAIETEIPDIKKWRSAMSRVADLSETLFRAPPYPPEEERSRGFLLESAAFAWECWDAHRLGAGVMSFSDLARYASAVLRSDKSYPARFRHIMIDEFQDTDELQDSIIRSLSEAWGGSGDLTRTAFIVGDIKQSIYRFRHANPRLFARYMGMGEHIAMSHSFRMSEALMNSVNMVFGDAWERGVINDRSLRVDYEPLLPPADAPWWDERNGGEGSQRAMEILLYEPPPDQEGEGGGKRGPKVREQRKKLALGLAKRLREMRDARETVWDREENCLRPVQWRDMTILARSRAAYSPIEEAFEESGIPVVFGSGLEYFNRGEVKDFISLLMALDDPCDGAALAGWIESPLSGMKPGAAVALLEGAHGDGTSLYDAFKAEFPGNAECFDRMRKAARFKKPSEAMGALLEDESWLDAYREDSRPRALANIRRGVELLCEYESSRGRSLPSCADYLADAMRGGVRVEEPEFVDGDRDAVRVMTVHSAKGLEFPVVALMSMESSNPGARNSRFRAEISRALGVVPHRLPGGGDSVRKAWHDALERQDEDEESVRLLYVAMTRAQDRLLCCGIPGKAPKSGLDWLSMVLRANEKNGNPIPASFVDQVEDAQRTPKEAHVISEHCEAAPKEPRETRLSALSATAYSLISWCPSAYRKRYRQGLGLKWRLRAQDGAGGADIGSLAHWALSRWDFDPDSLGSLLPLDIEDADMKREKAAIPPGLRHVWRLRRNRLAIREWLAEFASTPECRELKKALDRGTLVRELAFSVDHGGVNLLGSIDVFWEDENGCHVRDWKITPEDSAPHGIYSAQVDFYAMACHIARPGASVDAGLIYLRSGENAGPRARKIENWDELGRRILDAARTASAGFEAKRADCASCPFKIHSHASAKTC